MKHLSVLCALVLGANLMAAMAPIYESHKELKAILAASKVVEALGNKTSDRIDSITEAKDDHGGYVIRAGKCRLRAVPVMEKMPAGWAGSAKIIRVDHSKVDCDK